VDESLLDVTDEDMDTGEAGKIKKKSPDQDKDNSFAGSTTSLDSQCPQELPLLYKVIRGNRLATLKVIDPTGEEKEQDEFGSFKDSEIGTKDKVVYRHLSSGNRNISLSFDPNRMLCWCKGGEGHQVLMAESDGCTPEYKAPPVFVVTDQHFQASIPSGDNPEEGCLYIIRVEDSTLVEGIGVWLDVVQGYSVPIGTVVVLSSLSHLAHVGVPAYAEDLCRASKKLFDRYGRDIKLVHGTPMPCCDLPGSTIRAWHDIDTWVKITSPMCRLTDTSNRFLDMLKVKEGDETEKQSAYVIRHRMPRSITRMTANIFQMDGLSDMKAKRAKLTHDEVASVKESLVMEVNKKFGANIGIGEAAEQPVAEGVDTFRSQRIVLVGGSHLNRVGVHLKEMDMEVIDLTIPGLVMDERTSDELTEKLSREMRKEYVGETMVVYQLFDNLSFLQGSDDNWRRLEKGGDGKYHAEGHIRVAEVPELKLAFRQAMPLLRAAGRARKVILSPAERYLAGKCCGDLRHMVNYSNEYTASMCDKLTRLRTGLKDHVHSRNINTYKVTCFDRLLGIGKGVEGSSALLRTYWRDDPVHLTSGGYAALAEALVDALLEDVSEFSNSGEPPKETVAKQRSGWLMGQDTGIAGQSRKRDRSWSGRSGWSAGGGGGGRGGSWRGRGGKFPRRNW